MIRRKLPIATAIIAAVVITACSDMTAPKQLVSGGVICEVTVAARTGHSARAGFDRAAQGRARGDGCSCRSTYKEVQCTKSAPPTGAQFAVANQESGE